MNDIMINKICDAFEKKMSILQRVSWLSELSPLEEKDKKRKRQFGNPVIV